jgi:hypothetical protein
MLLAANAQQPPSSGLSVNRRYPLAYHQSHLNHRRTAAGSMMLRLLPVVEIDEATVSARPTAA